MFLALVAMILVAPTDLENKPPSVHHHDAPRYAAVMSDKAPPGDYLIFEDGVAPEMTPGWRLQDVDVVWLGGERHISALAREGETSSTRLFLDFDRKGFESLIAEQSEQGRCLIGFEMWTENAGAGGVGGAIEETAFEAAVEASAPRFAGVFADGCEERVFTASLGLVEFTRLLSDRAGDHRLIDFESVVVAGRSRFSGLWLPGEAGDEHALLGVSWPTFHDLAHDLRHEGQVLVDFEVEIEPWHEGLPIGLRHGPKITGRAVISAIWRADPDQPDLHLPEPDREWLGVDYSWDQLDCATSQLSAGYGMSGVDPKTGEVLCDQENWKTKPAESEPLGVLLVDAHGLAFFECWRDHGGPLHDSGTAGPP